MSNQDVKRAGEDAAAAHLRRCGYRILHRNWRLRMGEIDIVAMKGTALVFVEVKSRSSGRFADPADSVGYRKQQRLRRLAEAYLAFERPEFGDCRFDVISVVANMPEGDLRHIEDAF